MTTPTNPPPDATAPRKKYKYTQQLIHIALEDLTQEEIARICRVSQSVVSGWKHGQSRANEHQIAELKRRYGHRLHRATFRVYLAVVDAPRKTDRSELQDWEPTRSVTQPNGWSTTRTVPEALRVVQVEGAVTLRHTLHIPLGLNERTKRPEREPAARWLVHHLGRDRLVLVRQRRRLHHDGERELWEQRNRRSPAEIPVEANDDAARWISHVEGPMSPAELLARADAAVADEGPLLGVMLLPFLVRKMLLELGYPVEGVVRIDGLPLTGLPPRGLSPLRRRRPLPSGRFTRERGCRRKSASRSHTGQGRVGPGTSRIRDVPGPFSCGTSTRIGKRPRALGGRLRRRGGRGADATVGGSDGRRGRSERLAIRSRPARWSVGPVAGHTARR